MVKKRQQGQQGYDKAGASSSRFVPGVRNVLFVAILSLLLCQLGTLFYGQTQTFLQNDFMDGLFQELNVTVDTTFVQEIGKSAEAVIKNLNQTGTAFFQETDEKALAILIPTVTETATVLGNNTLEANLEAIRQTNSSSLISSEKLVIDILQIGSNVRPELMIAQQQSFGSHVSVRHIFNATEDDDDDQLCSSELSKKDTFAIARFCKGLKWDLVTHEFMRYMQHNFARPKWLQQKANPVGWMCAQKRSLHGLYKVFQIYHSSGMDLPDHLILMDDDTYYNMDQFHKLYVDETPDLPLVRAGCLVRMPIHSFNFSCTFPFGGYGVAFNRPSLQVMMKPIHCPRDTETCARLQDNQIGEYAVFRDGMTLIDLIQAYAKQQPYRHFRAGNWTTGWCLHSDWAIGYFVNFYNVTRHSSHPAFVTVANDRLQEWLGSGIYRRPLGMCRNRDVSQCQPDSLVCHYMTPSAMVIYTNVVKQRSPDRFKDAKNTSSSQA